MEHMTNRRNELAPASEHGDGWEAWDAVPRDGPAVFVIDTAAFDAGIVRGRWLDVAQAQPALQAELTELLGREPDEGTWAVVDQIGLGPAMAPETLAVHELATVAEDLRTEPVE